MTTLEPKVPQFLFDNCWIAAQRRLVRRWLPATVCPEPTLQHDRPWEARTLVLYGTVLPDPDGGYRLYYSNFVPHTEAHGQALRNVCVALGNWGSPQAQAPLLCALSDGEPLVRGHAAWALGRIAGGARRTGRELAKALGREPDESVRDELESALDTLGAGS